MLVANLYIQYNYKLAAKVSLILKKFIS